MTDETREQPFGRHLATKKAAIAYGLSEYFEDEESFVTAPSSSASWTRNLTAADLPDLYAQTDLVDLFVSHIVPGAGETYLIVNNYTTVLSRFGNTFEILPTTSGALETLFTIGQGGSMSTQQPAITDEQSVEKIIRYVLTTLPVNYRARLASRLSELEKAVREEELDGRGIAVNSMYHFIEFLKAYPRLRCPAVSITPDQNIYASWKSASDRVFSIHFLPDGKVRFVIFHPNTKHPGETIRLSGTATVDIVMSVAAPHGVLDWASA